AQPVPLLRGLLGESLAAPFHHPPATVEDADGQGADRLFEVPQPEVTAPAAALEPTREAQQQAGIACRADRLFRLGIGGLAPAHYRCRQRLYARRVGNRRACRG